MANITLPANSTTLILNGRAFVDLAEGDNLELAPVNPKTSRVNGENGVTVANRSDGGVYDLTIRVLKQGDDDVFLNNAMNQSSPVIFNGSMKTNFVKDGTDGVSSWDLQQGSLTDRPTETVNTQDGNALMEYKIQFRDAIRSI